MSVDTRPKLLIQHVEQFQFVFNSSGEEVVVGRGNWFLCQGGVRWERICQDLSDSEVVLAMEIHAVAAAEVSVFQPLFRMDYGLRNR